METPSIHLQVGGVESPTSIGFFVPKSWGGSHFWIVFILARMFPFLTKVGESCLTKAGGSCLFCFIYFGQDVPDFHSPMKGQSYGWSLGGAGGCK